MKQRLGTDRASHSKVLESVLDRFFKIHSQVCSSKKKFCSAYFCNDAVFGLVDLSSTSVLRHGLVMVNTVGVIFRLWMRKNGESKEL